MFSEETWNKTKENTRLSVSLSFDDYITERTDSLNERLEWLSNNLNKLEGISLEKEKLSISRLERDVPEEAKKFSASLYQMLPRIKLTDLLMDVAHITGFHEQFTHASNNRKPDKEETIIIMAALLFNRLNIQLVF